MATTPDVLQAAVQTLMTALRTEEVGKLAAVYLDPPDESDMQGQIVGWTDFPMIVSTQRLAAAATGHSSTADVEWLVNAYISIWENDASSSRTRKYLNLFMDAMLTVFLSHHLGGVDPATGVKIRKAWLSDASAGLFGISRGDSEITYGLLTFPIHYLQYRTYTTATN